MMNPLWQSLPLHGRKGLILAGLILGMSTTIGHATTIEHISLNKEENGKLHINVNVSGNAAEFKPQEQEHEGVYTLDLVGKTSEKVRSTPLIMDATGQHIARLNVESGKLSVVLPGVHAQDVQVHMKLNPLDHSTTQAGVSQWSTFSVNPQGAHSLMDYPPLEADVHLNASSPSKKAKPKLHASHHRKRSTPFKQRSFSPSPSKAQIIPPSDKGVTEIETPRQEELSSSQNVNTVETSPLLNKDSLFSEVPVTESLPPLENLQAEPAPPIEVLIAPEEAYQRYLRLPWQREDWINARVAAHLTQIEAKQFNTLLWQMAMVLTGLLASMGAVIFIKKNPKGFSPWRRNTKVISIETTPPAPFTEDDKPFASWLLPDATEEDSPPPSFLEQMAEEDLIPLDAPSSLTGNSIFSAPAPSMKIPSLEAEEEVPLPLTEAKPIDPLLEKMNTPKVGQLKAPSYFAFRHQQSSRQPVVHPNTLKTIAVPPQQNTSPSTGALAGYYERLNRGHFG